MDNVLVRRHCVLLIVVDVTNDQVAVVFVVATIAAFADLSVVIVDVSRRLPHQ